MTYTEQQFLSLQRKRSSSFGRSVVGLLLPIRRAGVTESGFDTPTYLRRRIARANGDDALRLMGYVERLQAHQKELAS